MRQHIKVEQSFPILILVPVHTDQLTPGTTFKPEPSQVELVKQTRDEEKEDEVNKGVKDISAPGNEKCSRGIFEKRPRGRPKGSKRAEQNCSCSNCGSWRKTELRSGVHNCGQCGQMFRVWGHYKAHMMNHESRRPHCCTECSKSFVRLEDLRRHFVTHGDFKFKCETCEKQFFRAEHLKKHKKCERSNITGQV